MASHESHKSVLSKPKRLLIITLGHISVLVGLIGLLVPVMPTSPFIILASVCYARTSERFHLMLLNNRYFGVHVRNWHRERCLQKSAKHAMLAALVISFSVSIAGFVWFNPWNATTAVWVFCILVFAIIAVSLLARMPVCASREFDDPGSQTREV